MSALSRRTLIGATAATLLTAATPAFSGEFQQASYRDSSLEQVENRIEEYVSRTGNIGILLAYGKFDGAPPAEAIGNKFVEAFNDKGADAEYFIYEIKKPGAAIAYYVHDVVMGTYGITEAAKKVSDAVGIHNADRTVKLDEEAPTVAPLD